MGYQSEAAKVRDMPNVMKYIVGEVADVGCGHDKIIPTAEGYDGRPLEGVDTVKDGIWLRRGSVYSTVFSSHFLEHVMNPSHYIQDWWDHLVDGGYIVLYLPEKSHYNSHDNPEHMFNWSYEDFMFWFRRCFCGEGKDFRGNNLPKLFELVEHGLDIGVDRYSFYIVAKRV